MGDGRLERHEVFVAAAVLGAHAGARGTGFRQRDVKFLIELFSNWVECALRGHSLQIQNTQVLRYLEALAAGGFARRLAKKEGYPSYKLTREGLVELLERLVDREGEVDREEFFFLYYFLRRLKLQIDALLRGDRRPLPYSLRLKVEELLDIKRLLAGEIERATVELKKLQYRMEDAGRTAELVKNGLKNGKSVPTLILEVERLYPFELNTQISLSELIREIPEELRSWELMDGNARRIEEIWTPCYNLLRSYIEELRRLLKLHEEAEHSVRVE